MLLIQGIGTLIQVLILSKVYEKNGRKQENNKIIELIERNPTRQGELQYYRKSD
jgi:hypothetical protein